jgi:hypothetical protein
MHSDEVVRHSNALFSAVREQAFNFNTGGEGSPNFQNKTLGNTRRGQTERRRKIKKRVGKTR